MNNYITVGTFEDNLLEISYDNLYIQIEFPDVQFLMEQEGFQENTYLNNNEGVPSSTYFVNLTWYLNTIRR